MTRMKTTQRTRVLILSLLLTPIFASLLGTAVFAKQIPPVDDAKQDPSLLSFRQQLTAAVKKRDDRYIKEILAPNVKFGLGAAEGKYEFLRNYQFLKKDAAFWKQFESAITHGGTLSKASEGKAAEFNAPYARFDQLTDSQSQSANEWGLVADKNVALRDRPDDSAAKVTVLNYDLVQVPSSKPIVEDWMKVIVQGGKTGFVHRPNLILRSDPYATFQQDHGHWRLTWFGSASP